MSVFRKGTAVKLVGVSEDISGLPKRFFKSTLYVSDHWKRWSGADSYKVYRLRKGSGAKEYIQWWVNSEDLCYAPRGNRVLGDFL